MTYQEFIDWITSNRIQFGIILVFIIWGLWSLIKTSRKKKQNREEELDQPPKEPIIEPKNEIDLDLLDMDMMVTDIGTYENNNLNHLKALKSDIEEQIRKLMEEGEKARKQHDYLELWAKKAKIHIQALRKQIEIYDEQIRRIGWKKDE